MARCVRLWSIPVGMVLLLVGALPRIAVAQCVEGCTAIHTILGEAAGDQFGWEGRVLGDVDLDGINDFIISAPTNDGGGADAGRVYVYSGATGTELYRVTGPFPGTAFGYNINGAGDINGDGVPDFLAAAPFTTRGRVSVHSGVDGAQLVVYAGEDPGDQLGFRTAGMGHLDFDGVPDLLLSAPRNDAAGSDAGRVYGVSGADNSVLFTVDGVDPLGLFGTALAFVGDVNNDGRDEFVVGAQDAGPTGLGRAYLCSFDGLVCTRIHEYVPGNPAFAFGQFFVGGRHDVDADGVPDVYVSDFNVNRAHIYSGATHAKLLTLRGDNNGGFGIGEILPDIDNDGHADLLMAAWISNAGGTQAGKAFVYSGRTGAVLETFTHNIAGATFGFDAAGIGDVNGDGRADHLITAAWDAGQRGTVYVIAGGVVPYLDGDFDFSNCVDTVDAEAIAAQLGCAVSCAADLDGDADTDLRDLAAFQTTFGSCRQ